MSRNEFLKLLKIISAKKFNYGKVFIIILKRMKIFGKILEKKTLSLRYILIVSMAW